MISRARRLWAAAAVLAAAGAVAVELARLPDVALLARHNPSSTAFIDRYRAQLRSLGQPDQLAWQPVPLTEISPTLALAVLVSEDIGFFSHRGFELAEMQDAVHEAVTRGVAPRGASTITQQLAKNLWLSPSRNPLRKLREALLTRRLERRLTKERILELYLNVAEFGPGIWGAEAAARHYFNKPAADLAGRESALLASALSRPSAWNPVRATAAYLAHAGKVESRMARASFLRKRLGLVAVDPGPRGPDSLVGRDSPSMADPLLPQDTSVPPQAEP